MRTTLDINDDVLALARAPTASRCRSAASSRSSPARRWSAPFSRNHQAQRLAGIAKCAHHRYRPRTRQPDARRGALVAYLLDINVLIAVLDAGHVQHEAAHECSVGSATWLGQPAR